MVIDVEDNDVYSFRAFEVGSTFRFNKCLNRLDFVINRWIPVAIQRIRGYRK